MRINKVEFNTDLRHIVDKLQLELMRRGSKKLQKVKPVKDYLMICCPYHKNGEERKPSAQLRETDGLFWCFTCHKAHSLPEVITDLLGENGWTWLLRNFSSVPVDERKIELNWNRGNNTKSNTQFVNPKELAQYRFIHPYMYKRKLSIDIIRKFDIGYDKDFVLETRDTKGKIIKQSHIGECITFPVKDVAGNILFVARRSIHQKFFHYPYGAEKPLYGNFEILRELAHGKQINEIYVCESMLDALVIWSWGKYAVALNGTGSETQFKLLQKLPARTLILATDNDAGGKAARANIYNAVKNKFIKEISYESYGDCKDINDMTKEQFENCKIVMYIDENFDEM